jgi:hypothetical protein
LPVVSGTLPARSHECYSTVIAAELAVASNGQWVWARQTQGAAYSSPHCSKLDELHGPRRYFMLSFDRNLRNRERKIPTQPPSDRYDEQALLDRELHAFERRQRALIAVAANRGPLGEFKAADAEWQAARAECERVIEEISLAS